MSRPLRVLLVEDRRTDAELVVAQLRRSGFTPEWHRVDTEAGFVAGLDADLDVILCDYAMPGFSGLRALELLRERGLDIPLIIVSGTIGEETAVAAMKLGATDYLLKDRLTRLDTAVTQAMTDRRLRRERRVADEDLRLANAHLGQLLEHSPAVFYALTLAGGNVLPHLVSANITALLGFTAAETSTPEWWVGQLHLDDRELALNSRTETLSSGASRIEYRLRHKDGQYCWVDDAQRLVRDAAGEPVELIGVWTDITERKRAEVIVRQATGDWVRDRRNQGRVELVILLTVTVALYALAPRFRWLDAVTQWVLANDLDHLIEVILATIFLVLGLSVFAYRRWRETGSELVGRQQAQAALGLLHEELDLRVKQRTEQLGRANQALHAEMSERRRAEDHLRESDERFHFVARAMSDAVWDWDLPSDTFWRNEGYLNIYKFTADDVAVGIGPWVNRVHPDDRSSVVNSIHHAIDTDAESWSAEYRILRKDGSHAFVEDRGYILRDDSGKAIRMVGGMRDITARKRLDEHVRQAQRMEALGEFSGGIAHDFNNILGVIRGYTELASSDLEGHPAAREDLDAVMQATGRATDLVQQILTFSRQQPQERHSIQLHPIVAESLKLMRVAIPSTIEFDVSVTEAAPAVLANASQIHQVLMNLGINAWHAMQGGPGCLRVQLEKFEVGAKISATNPRLRPGPYVRVTVSDTGCGMDEETLRQAFEPFFTTKPPGEGTGLGLAVVHGIMESHDGAVTVHSRPGVGTVFQLYFPALTSEALPVKAETGAAPRGHGERVLVVDDEKVLARMVQRTLIALGYDVETATQPAVALDMVRADPLRFSLVITDQAMPGMTGLLLASQLNVLRPGLPIIMMTGDSRLLTPERIEAAGVTQLLPKPTTLVALGTVVHAVLSKYPPTPSSATGE